MPNNNPNHRFRQPQYRSVDGFSKLRPKKPVHPANAANFSRLPAFAARMPGVPATSSRQQTTPPRSSLLNTALSVKKRSRTWKKYVKRGSLAIVVLVLLAVGWTGFKFFNNVAKLTRNRNPFSVIASALNQVNLKSEGDWVNVLVAGYDPADGDITTDTIIVISINKSTNKVIMLSVPRDTWVNDLPGFGHQKINASNDISSFSEPGYPKGGMGELEKQIHNKLGITSDYYVLVNNKAYVDAVNAVGGIDINVQSVNPKGLYDPNVDKANGGPVKLTNGWHHLDGLVALGLVKARGDSVYAYGFPNSDFDREAHARQVMVALKDKMLTSGVLADPLRIGQLFDALGNNVQTDITLNDIKGSLSLAKKVNDSDIESLSLQSINGQKLLSGQVVEGLDVEAPTAGVDNWSQIQAEVKSLYSSNPVVQEAATVEVLNGSNVDGLAKQEETTLINDGFVVIGISDPNSVYPNSMIIDQSKGKDPASLKALQKLFSTNTTITTNTTTPQEATEARDYSADFVIVLGQNWNNTSTGQ